MAGGILVGLVPEGPDGPVSPGLADYPNGIIVLKYLEAKGGMPFVLLHEICHLFGAVDLEEPGSVMSLAGASFRIDRFTREIMAVNRDRSFRRGTCPLTPDRAAEALAVYGRREALHLGEPELRICLDELRAMDWVPRSIRNKARKLQAAYSAAEIQEIQDALDAGNRQRAADLAVRYYGIDTANVPGGIRYDATVADYGVTSFDGRIRLGPTAFASPEVLASTIAHETTHSNQAAAMRASDPTLTDWPASTVDYDEAVAYDTEVRSAHQTGLESNPAEFEIARSRRETHNGNLSAGDQTDYGNGGYPP